MQRIRILHGRSTSMCLQDSDIYAPDTATYRNAEAQYRTSADDSISRA